MPRLLHLAVSIPALLVIGCSESRRNEAAVADVAETAPVGTAAPSSGYAVAPGGASRTAGDASEMTAADTGSVAAPEPPATPGAAPAGPANPAPPAAVIPQMIIRTGTATVRVDSLEPAMARVEQLARRLGGYVSNSTVESGSQSLRQASLELKIPAARWNDAVSGLKPIGQLESQQTGSEDVGEEFVDVTARMTNARRLEGRLLDLLANRTGRLEDVLLVEREIARVREEIERYEGRLRYLRTRAAVSTLTVRLHEPAPVLAPGHSPILDAFRQAWRHFIDFIAGLIESLGVLIPLGLLIAAAIWLLRRFFGRRGPGDGPWPWQPGNGPPPAPPAGPPPPSAPPQPPHA
jgi:hypothetical protein